MEKRQLRQKLLHQRRSLPQVQWQAQSVRLCEHLKTLAVVQDAKTIGAFFSANQEPDLSTLFALPKHWGFPLCVGQHLHWLAWQPGEASRTGEYGILTPELDAPRLQPEQFDLLLVPAVAGDHQGYRLGYGGGYYDRLFSQPAWQEVPRLGITFAAMFIKELPHDPWDIPLNGFCTEAGNVWI